VHSYSKTEVIVKFVDEVSIRVEAGKGGAGCLGFRREKFVPRGGPDGGDGGDGGSIYLVADSGVNTLMDFRHQRILRAQNGGYGMGKLCTGKKGEDLFVPVPVGTSVYDKETHELIGDLTQDGETLCVAKGGLHGLGNARFKSSTNRAPRQTTPGEPGEQRELRLELKLLADVGLCGLPNAGKSTLIRSISHATPKVADYPFTTLHPHLGVVNVGEFQSFVVADIPGLIAGASEGVGLGVRFLKHLSRTHLLLQVVDISGFDDQDPTLAIQAVAKELQLFSLELAAKERWLVFNKIDLLPADELEKRCKQVIRACKWKGPVFKVSAVQRKGVTDLCQRIMTYLEQSK
jgi:GTP-binding protein